MSNTLLDNFRRICEAHKDLERAAQMEAYMRNKFRFYGITSVPRKELLKDFYNKHKLQFDDKKILISFIEVAWNEEFRELQYCAQDLAIRKKRLFDASDLPFFESLIVRKSWWDTVDAIASNLVGHVLSKDKSAISFWAEKWIGDENIWLKRTAILFQLKYKKDTDFELLSDLISREADHPDFFIRKSCGWALREYSKTDPKSVREFLKTRQFSPLTVKEASKYL